MLNVPLLGGMNSQHKTIGQMRAENLGMGDKVNVMNYFLNLLCPLSFACVSIELKSMTSSSYKSIGLLKVGNELFLYAAKHIKHSD